MFKRINLELHKSSYISPFGSTRIVLDLCRGTGFHLVSWLKLGGLTLSLPIWLCGVQSDNFNLSMQRDTGTQNSDQDKWVWEI